jgi:V/A-type H+-transporting ATPase subunit I
LNIKFIDELKRLQAQKKTFFYKSMFTIKGYVPTTEINIFKNIMSKFLIVFFVMDPKDNDVPVKFDNIWFFKGFEFLIKNFNGLSYYEKDVTWCIGLLFIIFGSLCFLDAGYSILLILTGLALYYKKFESIGQMFAITGFFSFLLGLTSGQFFGLIVGQDIFVDMTPIIPLSTTPTTCLVFSLIVGSFIMLFSYSVSIWQLGFKISLTGNSFFILSLMAHFIHQEVNLVFFEYISKIFMIITLLSWIMYPVDDLGKDARIANIVLTMYNGVVGSLQDIFSHMRLFGISLSGAILALVVNKIALMMPLIVTIIFSIIAHIIIYLLSVMSMYVHSSRLIFLEFGSNFIKGGNIFYSPLSRSLLK